MIFNTITDSITGATQSIRLFGKSSNEIKNIMGSLKQNGIKHTLFSMPLAEIDQQAIDDYNKYIRLGLPYEDALANARKTTNADTLSLIESSKGLVIQEEQITAAQNASTIASKAKSAALGALSSFGNMAFFALVSEGISLAATAIDNWIHRTEKANEAMDEAVSSYESAKSSLESINSELDSHNQRINELLSKEKLSYVEQGELKELQAITQELLTQKELEERQTDKSSKEAAKATINAYKEQYGEDGISDNHLKRELTSDYYTMSEYATEDDVTGNIAGYVNARKLLDKTNFNLRNAMSDGKSQDEIDELKETIQIYIDEIDAYGELVDQNITDLQTKKLSLSDEYAKALQKQESTPYLMTTDDKEVIATYKSINNALKMIYSYKDTESWNEMAFSDMFSTEGLEKTKEELIAMMNAGELTPDNINGFENIKTSLSEANLILEKGQTSSHALYNYIWRCAQASKEFDDGMQSALSFTDAWESLDATEDESLKSLKEELLSLAKAGELTVESFKAAEGSGSFLSQIGINRSDTDKIEDVVDTVNRLASSADRLESVKTDLNSLSKNLSIKEQNPDAAISSDVLGGMDNGLKEQTEEWDDYVAVMGSASSSAAEAEQATANLAAARTAETLGLNELNLAKEESVNQTYGEISALMSEGEVSGLTAAALFNLIATEQIFASQTLSTSGKIAELERLALAFGIVSDSGGLAAEITDKINLMTRAGRSTESINREVQNTLNGYSSSIQDKIKGQFGSIGSSPSGSNPKGSGGSGSSKTAKSETAETFNFIETAISRAEKAIDRLKDKAKDTFQSFKSRAAEYSKAIAKISDEIAIQQQAYDIYMANANNVGLDESLASQVRNGSLNIASITNDGTKEKIRQYKEWYEKALDCSDALYELRKQQKELVRESIELVITRYDKKISNSKSQSEKTEKRISLRESMGLSVGVKSYDKINKQNINQISYYRKQNQELRRLQKTVPKNSEAWLEYNGRMKENNNTIIDLKKNIIETARAAAALAGQAASLKVEKLDSKNDLLDAKTGNAVSAGTKNGYIDSKIKNIGKQQAAYDKAVSTDNKNINKSKKTLLKFKSTKANKKLLADVKKCVKSGKRISNKLLQRAEKLKDNGKLLKACMQYNEYIDARDADKEAAELFAETSKQTVADLAMEKFTNIQDQWDNAVYQNEQKETSLNNSMEINRGNGNKRLNQRVYASLITNEDAKRNNLIKKQQELQQQMDSAIMSAQIQIDSDKWLEMAEAIDNVKNSIDESTKSLQNYKIEMNQLKWELFDDALNSIKRINTESDYYIEMMNFKALIDEETSELTEYGKATLALNKNNYDSHLSQAKQYAEEYNRIMEQIKNGELSATDDNVVEKLRELEDLRRDVTTAAQKDAEANKNLLQEMYDMQLENISKLISKYKDLMSTKKDAYEYQRSIEDKVKNIAALQKRLGAYTNNDETEENRAKIQKIKLELEEAQQELKDTQYDKYISDTGDMLDELYEDFEAFLGDKLDITTGILKETLETLGINNEKVIETLKNMDGNLSSTLEKILAGQTDNNTYAEQTVDQATNPNPATATPPAATQPTQQVTQNSPQQNGASSYRSIHDYIQQNGASSYRSIHDYIQQDGTTHLVSPNEVPPKGGLMQPNVIQVDDNQLSGNNYSITGNMQRENTVTGEFVNIRSKQQKNEFNAQMSDNLWEYAKLDPDELLADILNRSHILSPDTSAEKTPFTARTVSSEKFIRTFKENYMDLQPANLPHTAFPSLEQTVNTKDAGDVNVSINELTLPNVKNYEEFKNGLIHDSNFERAVQSMTIDRPFTNNSLTKYKYSN